ncbi:MAG: EAL domain-containing protein [Gammaproteobacteria bacterium]|nr:EAL domain-containing protein [Gammaproteobacteria bacterium]
MASTSAGEVLNNTSLDILKERDTLGHALLKATASLAQGDTPRDILKNMCHSLAEASEHIRLAWMIHGNLSNATLKPSYAAGPASDYAYNLIFTSDQTHGPLRKSITQWQPVIGNIITDDVFSDIRAEALKHQLHSTLCLPIGNQDSNYEAMVAIYADQHDYFNNIGLDLYIAFAHVVEAAMEQATLMNSLSYMASHDQLTNIFNRRGLQERLKATMSLAKRYNKEFSIILFDLDRFKLINDGLGHKAGDKVLNQMTDILADSVRDEDILGRWGGEEFLCILPETDHQGAGLFAERMRKVLEASPIQYESRQIYVTASFGYATYPTDADKLDTLLASADAALYQAKYEGRNRTVGARGDYLRIHAIGNQLDQALRDERVIPAFQPIVDIQTGEVVAEETLARIIDENGQIIDAGHFIEAASRLQIIHRIDSAIIRQAFRHCVTGLTTGTNQLKHFINISADLLRHKELVDELLLEARQSCNACSTLIGDMKPMIIEITERELLDDMTSVKELLAPFLEFGFSLALDDFGSGYSSYQYLVDLPISIIKIDGELVRRLPDPRARAVIQGIQDTANQLDIITIAEYIENTETAEILKDIGINWGQGYYYGRPQLANGIKIS